MSAASGLQLELELPASASLAAGRCPASVRLRNAGSQAVMVNARLAVGYEGTVARELYADLLDAGTGAPAGFQVVDYDRDLAPPSAYRALAPGDVVTAHFDLFEWYAPLAPGRYRVVLHYQADEPLARPPADGAVALAHGKNDSAPVELLVEQ